MEESDAEEDVNPTSQTASAITHECAKFLFVVVLHFSKVWIIKMKIQQIVSSLLYAEEMHFVKH